MANELTVKLEFEKTVDYEKELLSELMNIINSKESFVPDSSKTNE